MKRMIVLALIGVLGPAPAAVAGESLLASGVRHVQHLAVGETPAAAAVVTGAVASGRKAAAAKPAPALQEQLGNLSKSGMSKRKKALIFISIGVGFAAGAYAIDHSVVDVTPSTKGTRQD
jgi:hypothetical protein